MIPIRKLPPCARGGGNDLRPGSHVALQSSLLGPWDSPQAIPPLLRRHPNFGLSSALSVPIGTSHQCQQLEGTILAIPRIKESTEGAALRGLERDILHNWG